jgi:uncharacterized glyoxalase superfamily protein PhnB
MSASPDPSRRPRIVPMLPVRHLPRAIPFYRALGFQVLQEREDWGWAQLALGDSQIMLDQSIFHATQRPSSSVLYLYPGDIKAFHAEARRQGLLIPDLETTFYGMLEFRIEDPDGNRLWIGQAPE